jgi:hypothetical protein
VLYPKGCTIQRVVLLVFLCFSILCFTYTFLSKSYIFSIPVLDLSCVPKGVAIDAPVVHNIWRLQYLLACMSMYPYPTGDPISVGWAHPFQFASASGIRSTLILTLYQCTKRTADGQSKLSCLIIDLRRIIPRSNHNHITVHTYVHGTSEKTRTIDFF